MASSRLRAPSGEYGSVTAAATGHGYEWALRRVTELEIELQRASSALQYAEADATSLKEVHDDLVAAKEMLQSKYEAAAEELLREREDKHQVMEELETEVAMLRARMQREQQARDTEELQAARLYTPWELEALRLQLSEEMSEPYNQRIHALEGRLSAEQRKVADCIRKLEVARLEADSKRQELEDLLANEKQEHDARQQRSERKITSLEAELRETSEAAGNSTRLQIQLQEAEAKIGALQHTLKEHELHSEKERGIVAQELQEHMKQASDSRSKAHQLQVQVEQEERRAEQAAAESDGLRRDIMRLAAEIEAERAKSKAMRPAADFEHLEAELEQLRTSTFDERLRAQKDAQALQDKLNSSALAAEKAELKIQQLTAELSMASTLSTERQVAAELRREAEVGALKDQQESSLKQASDEVLRAKEHVASVTRELEVAKGQIKNLQEDVAKGKAAALEHEVGSKELLNAQIEQTKKAQMEAQQLESCVRAELNKELSVAQADIARRDADIAHRDVELAACQEKISSSEEVCKGQASELESLRRQLQRRDQENEALRSEYAVVSAKLDTEREKWAKEGDDTHATLLRLEEVKRLAPTGEDHMRKQLNKTQAAAKKAVHKANRKCKELKQRCQELARRVEQLQHEKATVIRICEENKAAYERHMAPLAGGFPLAAPTPSVGHQVVAAPLELTPQQRAASPLGQVGVRRREMRVMIDRLEPYMQSLRSRMERERHAEPVHGARLPASTSPAAEQ